VNATSKLLFLLTSLAAVSAAGLAVLVSHRGPALAAPPTPPDPESSVALAADSPLLEAPPDHAASRPDSANERVAIVPPAAPRGLGRRDASSPAPERVPNAPFDFPSAARCLHDPKINPRGLVPDEECMRALDERSATLLQELAELQNACERAFNAAVDSKVNFGLVLPADARETPAPGRRYAMRSCSDGGQRTLVKVLVETGDDAGLDAAQLAVENERSRSVQELSRLLAGCRR
jgi:hypothetical protein